jgi:hypothetical protein
MASTPEQIEAVKSKDETFTQLVESLEAAHGRIGVVTHPDGRTWRVVMRKPKRAEYKMFRANSNNAQRVADAQETFLLQTCVYPASRAELDVLLDEWPGIPEACGRTILDLCGMTGVESGKG